MHKRKTNIYIENIEEIVIPCKDKKGLTHIQPLHDSLQNRLDYCIEKLKFYFENKEFETVIMFLEENFPNVLLTFLLFSSSKPT